VRVELEVFGLQAHAFQGAEDERDARA
jgi:hypothetical protein